LERTSFNTRTKGEVVLALALIHHLAIGKNIPFKSLAEFFSGLGKTLIIEFVPKDDPKVQVMLNQRKDVFEWYSETEFIKEFNKYFKINESTKIVGSERTLYQMKTLEKQ
jgi:transcriptional regulatory protein LevR